MVLWNNWRGINDRGLIYFAHVVDDLALGPSIGTEVDRTEAVREIGGRRATFNRDAGTCADLRRPPRWHGGAFLLSGGIRVLVKNRLGSARGGLNGKMEKMKPFLYGLDHASHNFHEASSLGKNIFTNAFPLSLAQYLSVERKLPIPVITAKIDSADRLTTEHVMTEWSAIIGTEPDRAFFEFEGVYEGYGNYTHTTANKSDAVVIERSTGKHLRPLEIKLVVVPTSSTAKRDRENQSCEIVVRPPTVEQLAFSIAHSYGQSRRIELLELIVSALGKPNDFKWAEEKYMISALPSILEAAENIVKGGLDVQTPLVLTAIWRSEGQKPVLDEHAFDVFAWTDMAFLQLFIDQLRREYFKVDGSQRQKTPKKISRPSRALIWLVRSLLDYTVQNTLNFGSVHSQIAYGVQSDKAGSFSGAASLKHLTSPEFLEPRVTRTELGEVLSPSSTQYLLPERRLDAAIAIQHLAEELSHQIDFKSDLLVTIADDRAGDTIGHELR